MVATKKIDITRYVTKTFGKKERQQQHLKSIKAEMQFARDRRHSAKTKKLKHTRYIYCLSPVCYHVLQGYSLLPGLLCCQS